MTAPRRMDWRKLLNGSRYGKDSATDDPRSPFQRDIDRITFSDHFRRLARKTQVHPLNENDHVHSRLTHSLEAASVGKSLGEMVGDFLQERGELPEGRTPVNVGEIVQAACLAHDIGNPPFGHSGEAAIKDWFRSRADRIDDLPARCRTDFTKFDGNAMAVRILLTTGFYQEGMSPSHAVVGALLKYPWPSHFDAGKDKFSYFQSEAEAVESIAAALGLIPVGDGRYARPPLAYLTEAADDICYRIIDMEDATELGILPPLFMYEQFRDHLDLFDDDKTPAWYAGLHFRQRNSLIRAKLIGAAARQAVEVFKERYDAVMEGRFDTGSSLMEAAPSGPLPVIRAAYASIKKTLFLSDRKAILEMGAQNGLGFILDTFMNEAKNLCTDTNSTARDKVKILLGDDIVSPLQLDPDCRCKVVMAILDYVSGMTDHYAREMHRKLLGLGE